MIDSDNPSARGRPVNEHARMERRQLILTGARACFIQRGFHASSISEIATAAGVSNANIYQYFENKDALILALIDEDMKSDLALIHRISASPLRRDDLRHILAPLFRTEEGRNLAILRCEFASEAARNPVVGRLAARSETLGLQAMQWGIRVAQANGTVPEAIDAETTAPVLAYLFDGLLRQRTYPDSDGEALLDALVGHFANILQINDR